MSLDYTEQFEYFQSNEYLRDYMKNDYYSCDRHLTAMHVQHIADRMNKEFTNKYNMQFIDKIFMIFSFIFFQISYKEFIKNFTRKK